MRRLGKRDRKVAENSRDSRKKSEFITGRHILVDIYNREYEV